MKDLLTSERSESMPQRSELSPLLLTEERSDALPQRSGVSPSSDHFDSERSGALPQRSGLPPSLTEERSVSLPQRSASSPSSDDFSTILRSDLMPKRSGFTPTIVAIDGGNDTLKPVFLVERMADDLQIEFVRTERRTPKTGKLSKRKNGEQKFSYKVSSPEAWKITTGRLIRDVIPELSGKTVRIEPDFGSYRKDRDEIIRLARKHDVSLEVCDAKLSARQRIKYGIPKDETCDETDAMLILTGHNNSFGPAKLMSEKKTPFSREKVKKSLEISEESGWSDALSKEALSLISSEKISEMFGADLSQPVFIVSAYAAAKDPQVKNQKGFR